MAELNPKPFLAESGFLSRVFKGAPAYYAKPDLQQYFDSLEHNLDKHNKLVLGDAVGRVVLLPDSSWNIDKSIYNLHLGVTDPLVLEVGKFKVPFVGGSLDHVDSLVFDGTNLVQPTEPATPPTILESQITNVLLLAKERTITFADDPDKGGIIGPGIPAPLESSDVIEYYDFSLGVFKGLNIPETINGKLVVCVVAQFTFYFDGFWKPLLIQNFRTNHTNMDISGNKRFPVLNKVLSSFGQFDWINKVMDALNSLALRIDGSNEAITDLYVDKGATGRFKIITREDYASTTQAGIIRIATDVEVFDPTNNSTALSPYGMYLALGSTRKIYEIGIWDMLSTDLISFPHNLGADWVKAVPSACSIRNDAGDSIFTFFNDPNGQLFIDDTYITLHRIGVPFNHADYSDVSVLNRGYVILDLVGVAQINPLTPPDVDAGADIALDLASSYVETTVTGVINSFVGSITNRGWSVVSGPAGSVQQLSATDPNQAIFRFSSVGTWVLRFSATASDGTGTNTGSDLCIITVSSTVSAIPVVTLRHSDNTTAPKAYPITSTGNVLLIGSVTELPTANIQAWEFEYRSRVAENNVILDDWSAWSSLGFNVVPGNPNQTNFFVNRPYGPIQFRARVQNTSGNWTTYSNVLEGTISFTAAVNMFEASGTPYLPNTGTIGATPPSTVATSLKFRVCGIVQDPGFLTNYSCRTTFVEYDPNNVQALPSDILVYNRGYASNTHVANSLFVDEFGNIIGWTGIEGIFNCYNATGRTQLKNKIKDALQAIGMTLGFEEPNGNYQETSNFFTNVQIVATDVDLGNGIWEIAVNCNIHRGTSQMNETLLTTNPPRLARRVVIIGTITDTWFTNTFVNP